jgi:hypothetical protein
VFWLDYSLKLLVFDTDTYIGTALDPALNPFSDLLNYLSVLVKTDITSVKF